MADNGLITHVPVLQFVQCRQPGQKPWWAVRGAWGVNSTKEEKEVGRRTDMESRVREKWWKKMTPRSRVTEAQIIRKGRKRETKSKEARETETEYQWSATEQCVTQI